MLEVAAHQHDVSTVSQTEGESLSGWDNQALLTEASTYQPVLLEVPVITGVEEGSGSADQEDQEELEFPHDLLPSLDFSSELNIWESSLGYVETCPCPQLFFHLRGNYRCFYLSG